MSRIAKPKNIGNVPPRATQIKEIMRCGTDPAYFISTYVKIAHPIKGPLPFKTYAYQDTCLKAFQDNRFVITNKSRQLGLSTLSAAYSLWMAIFQRDKNILCIATRLEVAKNFLKKVNAMYESLPKWLVMPEVKAQSVKYIEFANGSKIQAVPTGQDAGRSESLSLLIIDEAAHVEGIDDLWLGLRPALSCLVGNTKIFTDKGIFNIEDFHKDRSVGEYFELSNVNVYAKNGIEPVSHGYVSPESETLIFTTRHGYSVETTLNHPLWVLNDKGGSMIKAKDIKLGDHLRIQTNMQCYGENDIDPDLAYMVGGYVAEGNGCHAKKVYYGIQITNGDDDFKNVYKLHGKKHFGKDFVHKPSDKDKLKLYCYSKHAVDILVNKIGVDIQQKAWEKCTPKSIWTATKKAQCNYLSGLFDGDGSVGASVVVLSSTSKTLIQETQLLLSNMGFHPNIAYVSGERILKRDQKNGRKMPSGKVPKHFRDSWRLSISRSEYSKFASEIGFRIKRKQDLLCKFTKHYIQDTKKLSTCPVQPIKEQLKKTIRETGKTDLWFRKQGVRLDKWKDGKTERHVTSVWLERIKALIQKHKLAISGESKTFLDNISSTDVSFTWDDIVSITRSKNKTYDFTVPGTHTFIQNGILGSNTGGNAILISSPSGVGTLFHKIWVGAKEGIDGNGKPYPGDGTNDFYRIELPWTVHPEHDQEWYEKEAAEIRPAKGEAGVNMELNCQFVSSGEGFITQEVFDRLDSWVQMPIASFGKGGSLWVWKYATPGHRYLIPIDCARGDAKDFSTFQVIDIDADEVVAEFQAKISPEDLADFASDVGQKYNIATLCPELNSFGLLTAKRLKDIKYPKLFYEKFAKNVYSIYNEADVEDELPGITTGPKNRDEMMAKLENSLRTGSIRIYSKRLVDELRTFTWKGSKAQAMKGYNDDLVMSLAIGLYLFDASGVSMHDSKEVAMAMLAGMSKNTTTLHANTSLGGWTQQQSFVPPIIMGDNIRQHAQTQDQIIKREQSQQGPQNFANPWYRNWKWVIE